MSSLEIYEARSAQDPDDEPRGRVCLDDDGIIISYTTPDNTPDTSFDEALLFRRTLDDCRRGAPGVEFVPVTDLGGPGLVPRIRADTLRASRRRALDRI